MCGSASPTQFCPPLLRAEQPPLLPLLPLQLPLPSPWEVRQLPLLVQPLWPLPLLLLPLRRVPSPVRLRLVLLLRLLLPLLPWFWGMLLPRLGRLPRLLWPAPLGAPLRPELASADRLG